ncbi:phosphohexomutase domain-containing protein [Tabrizicola oligotrophica]|uniref:Phosphomannomutase n=1 Tax=Tabrizicola oligotrophica TaxID=2710650 RepID=A0A6M0QPK8_9RHOB|nr:phosphomannomutase [Tabrizicola oligotrophica]NEY89389.1 phosphomannomutase [Tabrizicola oligotrophica]
MRCFKAYDIRGRLGEELNPAVARTIARAFAEELGAGRVVLGHDPRASSAELAAAVAEGLMAAGCEVLALGLCGTEEMYFATDHLGADAGIEVTASHNPMDYNGMKLVGAGARPLSPEVFQAVKARAVAGVFGAAREGRPTPIDPRAAYVARLMSFVDVAALRPLKIVVNAGNGAAGPSFDALAEALAAAGAPLEFIRMHHAPDGAFPNGIPNPLLPENQPVTADAVRAHGADLGVAWDGDFDRCFLFDETGAFVAGEYVVGLLAEVFLAKEPGAVIVHDPRVIWNTQDIVARAGGRAVMAPTGHAYLKAAMRDHGAVYGGEMSAHHYFRDFMCCDSGMIPWLLVAELMGRSGQGLSSLLAARRAAFPSSGEVNFKVADAKKIIGKIAYSYGAQAEDVDHLDGHSFDMGAWRFNLRSSNTEPLLRLNVEAKGDAALVALKVAELSAVIAAG